MNVLKFSEEVLAVLDIFSYEVLKKTTNKYLKYLNAYILMINQCVYFITSVGFILTSSEDLSDWMQAVVQAISCLASTGAFLWLALRMETIERLHDLLQDIVDNGKFTSI